MGAGYPHARACVRLFRASGFRVPASTRFITRAAARNPALVFVAHHGWGPLRVRMLRIQYPPAFGSPVRASDLAHQLAAVDLDYLSDQVVGRGRGQERDDPGGLLRGALAAYGDGVLQVLADLGGREAVVERGGYDAGGDPVYQDVLGDELLSHRAGKGTDASLGGGVGDGAWPATVAGGDGGHVDDPASPLPPHHRQHRARAEKDRLQVDVHDAVPEIFGQL